MNQKQTATLGQCLEQYFTFTIRCWLDDNEQRRLLSLMTARTGGFKADELLSAVQDVDNMKNLQDERFCISRFGSKNDLRLTVIDAKLAALSKSGMSNPPALTPESRTLLRRPETAGEVFNRTLLDLARGLDSEAADTLSSLLVSYSCLPAGELLLNLYSRKGKERELLKVYRIVLGIYENHLLMPVPEWITQAAKKAAHRLNTELPSTGTPLPYHSYDPATPYTDKHSSIGFI